MPAVVRGGRRQSSKPAPKKPAKKASRRTKSQDGAWGEAGKLHALNRIGLSSMATGAFALITLALVGGVILFTGGRAEALGHAFSGFVDDRMVAMGFGLERVHVEGASPIALAAIKAKLKLSRGEALTGMDLNEVRKKVESVGWVRDAKVLRLLPDTLVISVTERERLAVWQHAGRTVVIDTTGQPIPEADPARFADLPLVVGEGANDNAGEILPLLRQRPLLMYRMLALVRVDDRRWDLRLKDGSLINLPASKEDSALIQLDQLEQKDRLLELGFARIDLRDPEMITVRRRDTSVAAQTTTPQGAADTTQETSPVAPAN
ncbi:MAG TPA: cell division protein FtsQ/DivIB [Caulobacteraceae bacterium]|jgi:cell division protein FtsQ|nr:cell division protein FtsQ/DivIB [Caulobacteraceae bacterium]